MGFLEAEHGDWRVLANPPKAKYFALLTIEVLNINIVNI